MKCRKMMTKIVAFAALLLALAFSSAAVGQPDGFFNNADGVHTSNGGATWPGFVNGDSPSGGGATWPGFVNGDSPLGGGATLLGFEEDAGGGATLLGFDNGDAPLGGGLLVLALSGVCYAGAKRVKKIKS